MSQHIAASTTNYTIFYNRRHSDHLMQNNAIKRIDSYILKFLQNFINKR